MPVAPDPVRKWRDVFDPLANYYGNEVAPLVDGNETYDAMYRALLTARSKGHYIYLLGWSCDERLGLQGDKNGNRMSRTSLEAVLKRVPRDVQIRAMLWRQTRLMGGTYLQDTKRAIKVINSLPNAAAVRDGHLPLARNAHHQKVLIVNGSEGVIGFCGGLDIYPDRVPATSAMKPSSSSGSDGSPQHDVHCRIQGPACLGLIDVFDQRWRSHPDANEIDKDKNKGPLIWRNGSRIYAKGSTYVRVTRTFNCVLPKAAGSSNTNDDADAVDADPSDPEVLKQLSKKACKKERTVAEVLFAAIDRAERFIYVEEQYMIDLPVAEALNKALNKGRVIMFLISGSAITANTMVKRRKTFMETVLRDDGRKDKNKKRGVFRVYYLVEPKTGKTGEHCYVHAKTWVFDDEMAIIGSANCNRRGLSSDSEANVCILDAPYKGDSTAKSLRKRLWIEHLGLKPDEEDKVDDPLKSADLWQKKSPTSRVREYDPSKATGLASGGDPEATGYGGIVDPDLEGLPPCTSNCC
jgi:phosphatidylserine/phosphatidylglycerophosphate/cardiolipin synthase-like enzyme